MSLVIPSSRKTIPLNDLKLAYTWFVWLILHLYALYFLYYFINMIIGVAKLTTHISFINIFSGVGCASGWPFCDIAVVILLCGSGLSTNYFDEQYCITLENIIRRFEIQEVLLHLCVINLKDLDAFTAIEVRGCPLRLVCVQLQLEAQDFFSKEGMIFH